MLTATKIAGFIGAGLAGAAYVPQIWHLVRVRCSAGVSRLAFWVWLLASMLVLTHAIAVREEVFIILGGIQSAATTLILVYATRYRSSYCVGHMPPDLGGASRVPGSRLEQPKQDGAESSSVGIASARATA